MAKHYKQCAKRANKPNPREDRNSPQLELIVNRGESAFFDNPDPRQHTYSQQQQQISRPKKRVDLIPRNLSQEKYVESLLDDQKSIVFAMGPAGCGKTLLATQYAIRGYQNGEFDKIVITRPAVSVDEQHGFLPGGIVEKLAPWCASMLDVFKEHYHPKMVERMLIDETILIAPLAYMRGRTFKNSIIIADEMQNATPNQMKMVLTRLGEGSKMLVTGDLKQHDRGYEHNGLKDFIERLETSGSKRMTVCRFNNADIERHPIIEEILRLYGDE